MELNQSIPAFGCQQFRVYSVDEGVAIIRTIAEHRWPMTINEAFALRDQFNWKPAPDDGRFFITEISGGEEDGSIGVDPDDRSIASEINFNLTTRLYSDAEPQIDHIIRSQYGSYVDALNSLYGQGVTESSAVSMSNTWNLRSRVSIELGGTHRFIDVVIESPAMLDLTEAEQRYFDGAESSRTLPCLTGVTSSEAVSPLRWAVSRRLLESSSVLSEHACDGRRALPEQVLAIGVVTTSLTM